jgi:hypothetical protein
MRDEHLIIHDRFKHENYNSRDEYYNGLGSIDRSLEGDDGKEDNVVAPEVHQHGGDVNPFPTSKQRNEKVCVKEGPVMLFLRSRESHMPPHCEGCPMCHVHVKTTQC